MPIISITANNPVQHEGNSGTTAYTFTVTRSGDTSAESTVNWQIMGSGSNSATVGTDFYTSSGAAGGSITFALGETSKIITVYVLGDTEIEPDEEFAIVLSNPTNGSLDVSSATSVITNDDISASTSIAIAALDANKPEGNGGDGNWTPFSFQVQRSGDLSGSSSVQWSIPNVSFDNPQANSSSLADRGDFRTAALDGTINFSAGESTKVITIDINGDNVFEADQHFTVHLSNAVNSVISISDATGNIQNDDSSVSISPSTPSIIEGNSGTQILEFTVTRQLNLNQSASVDWTASGTGGAPATAGIDFKDGANFSYGTVNFAAGESSKTIQIIINGDTTPELNESITIALSNAIGMSISNGTATSIITNDDATLDTPSLSISSLDASKYEGNSGSTPFSFKVNRSGDLTTTSSVQWAIDSSNSSNLINSDDLTLFTSGMNGIINFASGQSSAIINIGVRGDTAVEPDETLRVVLSNPVFASITNGSASSIIKDDDGIPTAQLTSTSISQMEGNSGDCHFHYTLTRSGNLSVPSSVDWQIVGFGTNSADLSTDFSADSLSGTINFTEGESSKTIDIKVRGDLVVENDETFKLVLSNPNGVTLSNTSLISTIVNDDTIPNLVSIAALSATKYEGNTESTPFSFTVTRTGDLTGSSSVNWSASNDSNNNKQQASSNDYLNAIAPSGKVTFAPGQSTATIIIQINGDLTFENDESFTVTLSNPVGLQIKDAIATGKILNDDAIAPTITFGNTDITQYEGNSGITPFNFTLTRTGDLTNETTVTWSILGNGNNPIDIDDFFPSNTNGAVLSTGIVKFNAGQATTNITINIKADAIKEQNEQFKVLLSNPINALLGNTVSNATIVNDDHSGQLIVTGTPEVGTDLKIASSINFGSDATLVSYRWLSNGKEILGSSGDHYTLTAADIGNSISATATYQGSLGNLFVSSTSTSPVKKFNHVPTGDVVIEGQLLESKILTAVSTLNDVDGMGYITYTWKADDLTISKSHDMNLQITNSLLGKSISVTASYFDGIGNFESVSSVASQKISGLVEGDDGDNILIGSQFDDQVKGEKGNDFLAGNEGNDSLFGGKGNDTLNGGQGDDYLNGGDGFDTLTCNGKLSDYTINLKDSSISDNRGIEGQDHFSEIELLKFSDRSINLGIKNEFNSLAQETATGLMELYIAFFQRIPDANGLSYWIKEIKNGQNLEQIASSFYAAGMQYSDLTGYKPEMSNADFINIIYKNVLGREDGADSGGLKYWGDALSSGSVSRGKLVLTILNSAHTFKGDATYGFVADLLDNRLTVAKKVSVDWGISYNSDQLNINKSMETLALVTVTDMTHALELVGIPLMDIVFV